MALLMIPALAGCRAKMPEPGTPRAEGKYGVWQVMVSSPGKKQVLCYAAALPARSAGTMASRPAKPYLMATRRTSGKIEISASGGYDFLPGSKVELVLDEDAHTLFFLHATAWMRSDAEDKASIDSMASAENIELRGVSAAGLTSIDYYSSSGFNEAIARIRELCP